MTDPAQRVDEALAAATIHHSQYAAGELYWQQWPCEGNTSGLPLVLLHGGFGSWNHWFRNLEGLRRQREVWTLDLPGLGMSGEMPEPHTTAHFADIILSGIDQLLGPGSRFDLGGFSFGAMLGGRLAAMAGARCRRLTLIGAAGFGDLHVQVPLLPPPGDDTPVDEAMAIQRENLGRLMIFDPAAIDEMAVYLHGDNLARHRFRSRKMAGSNDLAEALPGISAELVGVWGVEDATAGGRAAIDKRRELFLRAQPDAEFHVLEGVGHWAMYEAPEAVNRILLG